MGGPVDDKFKKMQDEMSRFEEEIGLPLPNVPLPPEKPKNDLPILGDLPPSLPPLIAPNGLPPGPFPPPPPPILQRDGEYLGPPMFGGPPLPPGALPPGMPLPPMPPMPPGIPGVGLPPGPPMPPRQGPPMPPSGAPLPPGPPIPGHHLQPLPPMPPMTLTGPGLPPFPPNQGMVPPQPGMLPMFPVVQPPAPPQEEKITPAIVSATPMLYVANPQLEIAAVQAERVILEPITAHGVGMSGDKRKLGGSRLEKPTISVSVETVSSVNKKKDKKNRKLIRTAGGITWEDPTLAEWEDDDFRLFCGDLGNDVTDEVLSRAFSKYPSFGKAKVIRDKRTNKTKGFGFVSFKDPQDFIKATKEMNGRYVGSRPIKLRKSTWKNRSLDVVRKKDKEKQQLISMLTGR